MPQTATFDTCYNSTNVSLSYLKMNNGVIMLADRGYRMLRDGSITGLSGQIDVAGFAVAGVYEFQARINGAIFFDLRFRVEGNGRVGWHVAPGLDYPGRKVFPAGAILTVYVKKLSGTYASGYPTGVVEVTYLEDD